MCLSCVLSLCISISSLTFDNFYENSIEEAGISLKPTIQARLNRTPYHRTYIHIICMKNSIDIHIKRKKKKKDSRINLGKI